MSNSKGSDGDAEDEDISDLRKRIHLLMSNDVMPHVCTLSDEEIDELCHQLFMYRQKRASGVHLIIAHGLVTTGIFRRNPFTKPVPEVSKETATTSSRTTLIQAHVDQPGYAQEPTRFNPEDTYNKRVEAIKHMLGGCGSRPPHQHSAGRFKSHASRSHGSGNINSRIGDEVVQFY
jgi:hypothetical protein